MTTALPSVLTVLAADLSAALSVPVHTGRAPASAVLPYVVFAPPSEAESEFDTDADPDRPTAVLATARVFGALGSVITTASAVLDRWMAEPAVIDFSGSGRRVISRDLAQNLPLPAGDPDSPIYGQQIAVRFHTEPTS